jgi:hypothetical protein
LMKPITPEQLVNHINQFLTDSTSNLSDSV